MSYTNGLDNPELYFQAKTYSGNGGTQSITLDGSENMQPDWVWIKSRSTTNDHILFDSVRGATKRLRSNSTGVEDTQSNQLTSFDTDGWTTGDGYNTNNGSQTYVSWNWLAGGTAPSQTYTVKVVSDSGNKYRFDDFGTSAVTLDLQEGGTYTFDQSDSSNAGHPLRFSETSNGTHGGGSEYTTGVTTNGTPGSSGAYTRITVAASAPTLYYYCSVHSGMGGQANTNSLFGSSNFSGSIQSTVSAGSTQGLSIVSYTGNATNSASFGHGLNSKPQVVIIKNRSTSKNPVYWQDTSGNGTSDQRIVFSSNASNLNNFHVTFGTDTITLGNTDDAWNKSGDDIIAYCMSQKKGYSKFGSYTGGGNPFVYLGFKPAWLVIKRTNASSTSWVMHDNKRNPFNAVDERLWVDLNSASTTSSSYDIDFLSVGFKLKNTNSLVNTSGGSYIYMAFAEAPFVTSTGIPTTAR